jgi:hypothetical protein
MEPDPAATDRVAPRVRFSKNPAKLKEIETIDGDEMWGYLELT